jgi:hypothetical protein
MLEGSASSAALSASHKLAIGVSQFVPAARRKTRSGLPLPAAATRGAHDLYVGSHVLQAAAQPFPYPPICLDDTPCERSDSSWTYQRVGQFVVVENRSPSCRATNQIDPEATGQLRIDAL